MPSAVRAVLATVVQLLAKAGTRCTYAGSQHVLHAWQRKDARSAPTCAMAWLTCVKMKHVPDSCVHRLTQIWKARVAFQKQSAFRSFDALHCLTLRIVAPCLLRS